MNLNFEEIVALTRKQSESPEPNDENGNPSLTQVNSLQDCSAQFAELVMHIKRGSWKKLEQLLKDKSKLEYLVSVHYKNPEGRTLLHISAKETDPNCVRVLLEANADVNVPDNNGLNPLHWTVEGGCCCQKCNARNAECIKLLIEAGAVVDVEDKNQQSPLYYAAKNMLPLCAKILLDYGAEINRKGVKGHGPIRVGYLLVQKIPEVMKEELDKGILYDEVDNSKMKLDFGLILQMANGQQQDEMDKAQSRKEMDLINCMLKAHNAGRELLLTHPLTEAFLHLKWISVRKWFYTIHALYYFLVLLYSIFIFDLYVNCLENPYEVKDNSTYEDNELGECHLTPGRYIMGGFVTLAVFLMIANEVYEIFQGGWGYFKLGVNYMQWVLLILVAFTLTPAFGIEAQDWQTPIAAMGVLIAWCMTLVQVSRIPSVGVYVEMLSKVMQDFAIFSATYASIILGFALAFCVLMPWDDMFKTIPWSLVKTLLLMIGETDYAETFGPLSNDNNNLYFEIMLHVIFAGFVILVTIILMNLLLGLAVSDIQELQKAATIMRVTQQVLQISLLESLIYSKRLPAFITSSLVRSFSVVTLESTDGQYFRFSPVDPADRSLPKHLKLKFIPYLTSSPCINKKLTFKAKLDAIKAARALNLQGLSARKSSASLPNSPRASLRRQPTLLGVLQAQTQQQNQQHDSTNSITKDNNTEILNSMYKIIYDMQNQIAQLSKKIDDMHAKKD